MNKSESKYFNTAIKIDKAFLELLEKKDFEYITVKEICANAGVNRSTFYLHYETIGDLLTESVQYIFDQFRSYFPDGNEQVMSKIRNADIENLYLITPELLRPYLTFISDHRRLFVTALLKSEHFGLSKRYQKMFIHVLSPILDGFRIPQHKKDYMIRFYIGGIMGIVLEWLKRDCSDSIDFMIEIISELIPKAKENL